MEIDASLAALHLHGEGQLERLTMCNSAPQPLEIEPKKRHEAVAERSGAGGDEDVGRPLKTPSRARKRSSGRVTCRSATRARTAGRRNWLTCGRRSRENTARALGRTSELRLDSGASAARGRQRS